MAQRTELYAVQPYMAAGDFVSAEAYHRKIESLFAKVAALRGPDKPPALVVFPEEIATFLVLQGLEGAIGEAKTTSQALTKLLLKKLPAVVGSFFRYRRRLSTTVFLLQSPQVYKTYLSTFRELSRRHQVTVVAGSALLPGNRHGIGAEAFEPESNQLYNISYLFGPDGAVLGETRKVNVVPTQEDIIGMSGGPAEAVRAIDTPAGKVGTLVCYDGFARPHTENEPHFQPMGIALDQQGAQILAQPSANPWAWDAPWLFAKAGDGMLRRDQWFKEGLAALLPKLTRVRYVVNPQLLGQVFEHRFDGRSVIMERKPDGTVVRLAEAKRTEASLEAEEVLRVEVSV